MELAKDLESICSSCYCLPTCSCEDNEEELQGKIDLIDKEIDKEKLSNSSELELTDEKKENFNFQYNSWESTSESSIDEVNSNQDNICQYEDIKRKHKYSIQDQTEMNEILYSYPHPDSERADTVKEVFFLKSRERTMINPSETKIVETNMKINHYSFEKNRKLEITDQISSGWLDEYFLKLMKLKTGVISPSFRGTLYVKIYNKSNLQVTIPKNAPIGTMISSVYEYI